MKHTLGAIVLLAATTVASCDKKTESAKPGAGGSGAGPTATSTASKPTPAAGALLQKHSSMSMFLGADDKHYFTSFELTGGTLTAGATIDAVDAAGNRVTYKIDKLQVKDPANGTVDAKQANPGQEVMIDLAVQAGDTKKLGEDFFFVNPGAAVPADAIAKVNADAAAKAVANGVAECKLDDKPWPANVYATGITYYKNGIKMMKTEGTAIMLMPFLATAAPDDRQLTVSLTGWPAAAGVVDPKYFEVLLSGSPTGDKANPELVGWKNNKEHAAGSAKLEFTKWEVTSPQTVIADATLEGKLLRSLSMKPGYTISCKFSNLKIKIEERSE